MSIALRRMWPVSLVRQYTTSALWQPLAGPLTSTCWAVRGYSDRQVGYIRPLPTTKRPWRRVCLPSRIQPSTSLHAAVDLLPPSCPRIGPSLRSSLSLQLLLDVRFGSPTSMSHRYRLSDASMTTAQSIPGFFLQFCVKTAWLSRRHLTLDHLSSSCRLYRPP